jgi:hypothetical protein
MGDHHTAAWEEMLAKHGHSPGHVWVFRDDLVWNPPWHMFHVVIDDPVENHRVATRLFDCREARSLGVELSLLGSTRRTSYCTMFVPRGEREAEQLMIGGIKYRIPCRPYVISTRPPVNDIYRGQFPFSDHVHWRAEACARE